MPLSAVLAATRPHDHDDIVVLDGATWADYVRLLEIRGDRSAPRIAFLEGALEIMSPSFSHESIKSLLGCLVEAYCFAEDIRFHTIGSWTLKKAQEKRGLEPDECYYFGVPDPVSPAFPHLAIEVIWSHGGLDKLEIYRKLGVQEVWIWKDDELAVHVLRGERFAPAPSSTVLPELDLSLLTSFLDRPTAYDAVRAYRAALAARG